MDKFTENQILDEIFDCYCELSPEYLSPEGGDFTPNQQRNRAKFLKARLKELFGQLGREVTEEGAFARRQQEEDDDREALSKLKYEM